MSGIAIVIVVFLLAMGGLGGVAYVVYQRKLRRAKAIERGLKMVPVLIHLPPPSQDTEGGSRDLREVMREKTAQAEVLYNLLAGVTTDGLKARLYGQRHIALELIATDGLVHFFAAVPVALVSVVEKAVLTAYPGARLEQVEDHNIFNQEGRLAATMGGEMVLRAEASYPVATYREVERDPLEAILTTLTALNKDDGAAIQIMVRPAQPNWVHLATKLTDKLRKGRAKGLAFSAADLAKAAWKPQGDHTMQAAAPGGHGATPANLSNLELSAIEAVEEKTKHPAFEVLVRVLVSTPTVARSQQVLRDLATAFALFERPGLNGFKFLPALDVQGLVTAFIFRFFPPELRHTILNSQELATLFHLPDSQFTPTANVERQQSKQVDGPVQLPTEGLLFGYNEFRGVKKEIRLSIQDRRRHTYILGQTGTGKSTMLENLAVQDMLAGNGFAFIDPHGDTAEKLLSMVPKSRAEDIVYFNPGDTEYPLGLNLFEFSDPTQKDFLVQETINMLYKLYDPGHTGIIGPRYEHWYRNAALTLMSDPNGSTFIEIPKVFTDTEYLKQKFRYLKDPTVIDFWTKEMGQTSDYHKSEMLGWFVSKFGAFQNNEMMRNIIGQTKSAFNLREVMDQKKILIVNLSKGRVGELNSQLLGMIFVIKFQAAAMSRADTPEDQRADFSLYVDEFQNFSTDSFASILSEARKYRLNLIVANQFIGQLSQEIRDAVFGNIGTILAHRMGPEDAEFMVKQFAPVFEASDLVNIPNYNSAVRLMVGGVPSQPFTMHNLPPLGTANAELGLAVKQLSAAKYGMAKSVVEADIMMRLTGQAPLPAPQQAPALPAAAAPPAEAPSQQPVQAVPASPVPPAAAAPMSGVASRSEGVVPGAAGVAPASPAAVPVPQTGAGSGAPMLAGTVVQPGVTGAPPAPAPNPMVAMPAEVPAAANMPMPSTVAPAAPVLEPVAAVVVPDHSTAVAQSHGVSPVAAPPIGAPPVELPAASAVQASRVSAPTAAIAAASTPSEPLEHMASTPPPIGAAPVDLGGTQPGGAHQSETPTMPTMMNSAGQVMTQPDPIIPEEPEEEPAAAMPDANASRPASSAGLLTISDITGGRKPGTLSPEPVDDVLTVPLVPAGSGPGVTGPAEQVDEPAPAAPIPVPAYDPTLDPLADVPLLGEPIPAPEPVKEEKPVIPDPLADVPLTGPSEPGIVAPVMPIAAPSAPVQAEQAPEAPAPAQEVMAPIVEPAAVVSAQPEPVAAPTVLPPEPAVIAAVPPVVEPIAPEVKPPVMPIVSEPPVAVTAPPAEPTPRIIEPVKRTHQPEPMAAMPESVADAMTQADPDVPAEELIHFVDPKLETVLERPLNEVASDVNHDDVPAASASLAAAVEHATDSVAKLAATTTAPEQPSMVQASTPVVEPQPVVSPATSSQSPAVPMAEAQVTIPPAAPAEVSAPEAPNPIPTVVPTAAAPVAEPVVTTTQPAESPAVQEPAREQLQPAVVHMAQTPPPIGAPPVVLPNDVAAEPVPSEPTVTVVPDTPKDEARPVAVVEPAAAVMAAEPVKDALAEVPAPVTAPVATPVREATPAAAEVPAAPTVTTKDQVTHTESPAVKAEPVTVKAPAEPTPIVSADVEPSEPVVQEPVLSPEAHTTEPTQAVDVAAAADMAAETASAAAAEQAVRSMAAEAAAHAVAADTRPVAIEDVVQAQPAVAEATMPVQPTQEPARAQGARTEVQTPQPPATQTTDPVAKVEETIDQLLSESLIHPDSKGTRLPEIHEEGEHEQPTENQTAGSASNAASGRHWLEPDKHDGTDQAADLTLSEDRPAPEPAHHPTFTASHKVIQPLEPIVPLHDKIVQEAAELLKQEAASVPPDAGTPAVQPATASKPPVPVAVVAATPVESKQAAVASEPAKTESKPEEVAPVPQDGKRVSPSEPEPVVMSTPTFDDAPEEVAAGPVEAPVAMAEAVVAEPEVDLPQAESLAAGDVARAREQQMQQQVEGAQAPEPAQVEVPATEPVVPPVSPTEADGQGNEPRKRRRHRRGRGGSGVASPSVAAEETAPAESAAVQTAPAEPAAKPAPQPTGQTEDPTEPKPEHPEAAPLTGTLIMPTAPKPEAALAPAAPAEKPRTLAKGEVFVDDHGNVIIGE